MNNCNNKKKKNRLSSDTNDVIRENMKCPVCMEILLPPIYQCETGHNICYMCVEEVTECPLCKGDYGDTRNYFAEELVNSMTFPCKYEEYGCIQSCPGSELKDHQESCECQPYNCPELACKEVTGLHQMGKHLDKHGFKVIKGDFHVATIEILDQHFDKKTEYNPWRMSTFGREFYMVTTRQKEGNWHFWAWFLGTQQESKKYSYEIVLNACEKQVLYRCLVHSLRQSTESILKGGSCLILTDQIIKSLRQNGKLVCTVRFIQGKNWETKKEKVKPLLAAKLTGHNGSGHKKLIKSSITINSNHSTTIIATKEKESKHTNVNVPNKVNTSTNAKDATRPSTANNNNSPRSKPSPYAIKSSPPFRLGNVNDSQSRRSKSANKENNNYSKSLKDENEFVVKLRESLRCPGCDDMITPPVFQCTIGHSICGRCKQSREDCPLCRAPIGSTRNFFAEELLYKAVQRCRYHESGCQVKLLAAQIRLHENTCSFAPFECPFNTCRALVNPGDLLTHLRTHEIGVVQESLKMSFALPKVPASTTCSISCVPNIIMYDEQPFYPIVTRQEGGQYAFWVASQNAGNYRFELMLKKQAKLLAFAGPVLSLRMNQTFVILNGMALLTSEKAIKSLKTDDKLDLSLKITGGSGRSSSDISCDVFAFAESMFTNPKGFLIKKNGVIELVTTETTELFANKKTSVTKEEEEEAEFDEAVQIGDIQILPLSGRLPSSSSSSSESDISVDDNDGKASGKGSNASFTTISLTVLESKDNLDDELTPSDLAIFAAAMEQEIEQDLEVKLLDTEKEIIKVEETLEEINTTDETINENTENKAEQ